MSEPQVLFGFPHSPVRLIHTGAECYVELTVRDFETTVESTYVFDAHDADTMRELGQALIAQADSLDEVWSDIEEGVS